VVYYQVVSLTRELSEARLSEAQARHEAEGLRHMARIVEAQSGSEAGGGGGGGKETTAGLGGTAAQSASPEVRVLLQTSYEDLEVCDLELARAGVYCLGG
jgi:hypothetical protein